MGDLKNNFLYCTWFRYTLMMCVKLYLYIIFDVWYNLLEKVVITGTKAIYFQGGSIWFTRAF